MNLIQQQPRTCDTSLNAYSLKNIKVKKGKLCNRVTKYVLKLTVSVKRHHLSAINNAIFFLYLQITLNTSKRSTYIKFVQYHSVLNFIHSFDCVLTVVKKRMPYIPSSVFLAFIGNLALLFMFRKICFSFLNLTLT